MAVVLDNGGFSVKIGYSTDEEPRCLGAYLVLTLCGLALRSTRMTRPRVQRTSP